MGRGYIYHITNDPESVECGMDESDFYESIESMGCDYVANCGQEATTDNLEGLKNSLTKAGFAISEDDLPEGCAFTFRSGNEQELRACQCHWFEGWYKRFKELSAKLTLEQYACGVTEIHPIQEALNDNYDDAVYLDTGTGPAFYAFMRFMRTLVPDRIYYIENACVFMH